MPHLLVVEDDPRLRGALVRALRDRGHAVATAATGMSGLDAAVTDRPDLVVLDLGLPDVDGAQVLRMLRAVSDVPVIVATARDDEPDMVAALGDGADDYIVKPFGADQLDARIKAVLRRLGPEEPDPALRVGELVLDVAAREVTLTGRPLDLTPREFDLLAYLARRAGQVVSRRELLAEVWQQPLGGADKTVDVHLSWLRRKLGETAQRPRYLHTVRTVGVKLAPPGAAPDAPRDAVSDAPPDATPAPSAPAPDAAPALPATPQTAPQPTGQERP
ncbi:response regulator transcription factor [Streptomyces halobius]|uniref:Response regulator transcription factor n=1 Tax=Streptomyces halobius TaxID=2879846 RepID=A0ABY4M9Y5_9ACTN|nr:response regulator transcription factor [Streptomyces halobius]UQA94515.1 response regulator transcription factor [Streptomyces halobius]